MTRREERSNSRACRAAQYKERPGIRPRTKPRIVHARPYDGTRGSPDPSSDPETNQGLFTTAEVLPGTEAQNFDPLDRDLRSAPTEK
jgi:hypothetical protein